MNQKQKVMDACDNNLTQKQKVLNACDRLISYIHALEHTLMQEELEAADIRFKIDMNELRTGFTNAGARYNAAKDAELMGPRFGDEEG